MQFPSIHSLLFIGHYALLCSHWFEGQYCLSMNSYGSIFIISMQVRTLTALLLLLSLALSLLCLAYNLVQNRTVLSDPLYANSPHSYFTLKYHSYARQINAVQFAAQLIVIALEISALVFFAARSRREKTSGRPLHFDIAVQYLLLGLLFVWQGVVTGYSIQCQLEIGFAEGNRTGDTIMAVCEGVIFAAILIALIAFAYYFTTMQPKTAAALFPSRSDCPQLEDAANSTRGEGKQQDEQQECGRGKQQAINHFKPSFEQNHSPMSRMFQNMSLLADADPPAPASSRLPLLEQAQSNHSSNNKDSSKQEPAKKPKIVVPRLKLGEVRKKQAQQDFLYPLNNLEISIIGPQPQARFSRRSSDHSDSA